MAALEAHRPAGYRLTGEQGEKIGGSSKRRNDELVKNIPAASSAWLGTCKIRPRGESSRRAVRDRTTWGISAPTSRIHGTEESYLWATARSRGDGCHASEDVAGAQDESYGSNSLRQSR